MEDYEKKHVVNSIVEGYCKYMDYKGIKITQKKLLRHFLTDIINEFEDVKDAFKRHFEEELLELEDPEDKDYVSLEDLEREAYNELVIKPQK